MAYILAYLPSIRTLTNLAEVYMPNLVGIFVFATYLIIMYEVNIAIGCALEYMCKNVRSVCPYSMLVMLAIFAVW